MLLPEVPLCFSPPIVSGRQLFVPQLHISQRQGVFRIMKNQGGPPPQSPSSPPLQTKVTIVGKHEIYKRGNLIGPFLVHTLLGPRTPPPPDPPPPSS